MPQSHETTVNLIFFSHTLARLMFEIFKEASIAIACKDICREELVLLLEKGVSLGWWDKEIHKINYKIVSELIEFSTDVKGTKKNCVKRALFALDDRISLKKETKIFKYDFVCKRFTVQTHLWSLEFVIQINLEHETIAKIFNIKKS